MEDLEELLEELSAADRAYRAVIKRAQAEGGGIIRRAREKMGLSQRRLAERLGVNYTYISKIENGHTSPSKPVLRKLAQLVNGEPIEDRRALRIAVAGT